MASSRFPPSIFPPNHNNSTLRRSLLADHHPAASHPLALPTRHPAWGPLRGRASQQHIIAYATAPPPHDAGDLLHGALAEHGGALGPHLPPAAFTFVGGPAAVRALAGLPGVAWVGAHDEPTHKVCPRLTEGLDRNASAVRYLAVLFPRLEKKRGGGGGGSSTPSPPPPSYHPATAAAAEWAGALRALIGGSAAAAAHHPTLTPRNPLVLEVDLGPARSPARAAAARITTWLASQPATHWVSRSSAAPGGHPANWQASSIIQSGHAASAAAGSVDWAADPGSHPLWAAGVRGAGQVGGGGDSGVDVKSCYFDDPAVPFELRPASGWGGPAVFESTSHRKIRLYRALADATDHNGHGTHTMGSMLGSPPPGGDAEAFAYSGMAPDAKLAFTDLAIGRAGEGKDRMERSGLKGGGTITVPGDMGGDYYCHTYAVGARVHSDSWGSESVEYDYMAAEVDAFAWDHQDFLPVLAAGNEGLASASPTGGVTTVTSPATAKNCLAVGATLSSSGAPGSPARQFVLHRLGVYAPGGESGDADASKKPTEVESFRVVQAAFGGRVAGLYGRRLPLSAAEPRDACAPLQNGAAVAGTVTVVARGTCTFATKAANAQAAGAAAVLVYDDRISDFFIPAAEGGGGGGGVTIPAAAVPRRVGLLLASSAAASVSTAGGGAGGEPGSPPAAPSSAGLTVSFGPAPSPADAWNSLADFSSKGPTPDGRVKPDLVAPGIVQSAAASKSSPATPTCEVRTMQGTSMATPVAAGAALLVRDYFAQGFYPDGSPDAGRAHAAGAALVKAVLVAGAAELDGFEVDTGLPLAPPPSYRMGFGRVHVGRALPLAGGGGKAGKAGGGRGGAALPFNLQVVDGAELRGGAAHTYCLRGSGGPLAVSLAWQDAPGSPAAGRALVNDLDLVVRAAGLGGVPLLGNGGGGGAASAAGGSPASPPGGALSEPDRTNNVEAVYVAWLPRGDVSIEVRGAGVPRGPQPYALAVRGAFTGALASPKNPGGAGAGATAGACEVVRAVIRAGPAGLTPARDVAFEFGPAAGGDGRGGGGFECALARGGGGGGVGPGGGNSNAAAAAPPPPARAYKPCSSPTKFTGLADGAYTFAVRATGEASAAERAFAVDTAPPALAWAASPGALPSPTAGASSVVGLAWGAADASPVAYTCRLEAVAGPGKASPPRVVLWTGAAAAEAAKAAAGSGRLAPAAGAAPVALGAWAPCAPPAAYAWLLPGTWRVSVAGTDAAGNAGAEALVHEWEVAGAADERPAAFITAGALGPVPSADVAFDLAVLGLVGDRLEPVSPPPALECQLLPLAGPATAGEPVRVGGASPAAQPAPVPGSLATRDWTACGGPGSKPGQAAWKGLADGAYQFAARVKRQGGGGGGGGGGRRLAQAPEAAAPAGAGGATLDPPAPAPAPAAPPPTPATPPAFAIFAVDTRPPAVSITAAPPPASASTAASFSFVSDEEPAVFSCALSPGHGETNPAKRPKNAPRQPAYGPQACASPGAYTGLPDGRYTFSVSATDGVGNAGSPATRLFTVDTVPPEISGLKLPSAVATDAFNASFTVADPPPGSSGVMSVDCRLRLLAGAGSVGSPSENGTWAPCASPITYGPGLADGRWGLTLRAVDAAGNARESPESVVFVDRSPPRGAAVVAGPSADRAAPSRVSLAFSAPPDAAGAPVASWQCALSGPDGKAPAWKACTSPAVFKGLKSGGYSFEARPVDAAGNVGAASPARTFTVDASLPTPAAGLVGGDGFGGGGGPWSWTSWRLWAVVGAAGLGAFLVASLLSRLCGCGRGDGEGRRWSWSSGDHHGHQHHGRHHHWPAGAAVGAGAARPAGPPLRSQGTVDPALQEALRRSAAEAAARSGPPQPGRPAVAAAMEDDAALAAAIAASLEEARVAEAMRRSMR